MLGRGRRDAIHAELSDGPLRWRSRERHGNASSEVLEAGFLCVQLSLLISSCTEKDRLAVAARRRYLPSE